MKRNNWQGIYIFLPSFLLSMYMLFAGIATEIHEPNESDATT